MFRIGLILEMKAEELWTGWHECWRGRGRTGRTISSSILASFRSFCPHVIYQKVLRVKHCFNIVKKAHGLSLKTIPKTVFHSHYFSIRQNISSPRIHISIVINNKEKR